MRQVSVPIYAAAFFISVIIFAIGVYIGTVLDKGNVNTMLSEVEKTNQLALSSQLMLLMGDSSTFCPVYLEELGKLDQETEKLGLKLAYLEDIKGVSDTGLKKQYFVLETNAFLLSEKVKETCGVNFTTVLYFYSNKNCTDCRQQGYELINLKQKLDEQIRIYSFDGDLGSSLAEALKNRYSVKTYPSIVIGGNRTLAGFRTMSEVEIMLTEG